MTLDKKSENETEKPDTISSKREFHETMVQPSDVEHQSPPPISEELPKSSAKQNVLETAASVNSKPPNETGFAPAMVEGEVGILGPFRIVKQLGKGGMGAVYAAIDTRLDRKLALKVMLPEYAFSPSARERFLREARAAAKITHDNVVTVYEADERDGTPYIAMQFLQGYPLDEYVKRKGSPSISQIVRIAKETCNGLAAAHSIGLVHRDIKPSNLWLEVPNGRVKVLDFGLAKPMNSGTNITIEGAIIGTPAYMSPEQAQGEGIDHRTDIFSLGAVLYHLCTGELPFTGATTMAMLIALSTKEPKPIRDLNSEVPETLAKLIHQMLAKSVEARPKNTAEIIKRLRNINESKQAPIISMGEISLSAPQATPSSAIQSGPVLPEVISMPLEISSLEQSNPFEHLDQPKKPSTPTRLSGPSASSTAIPTIKKTLSSIKEPRLIKTEEMNQNQVSEETPILKGKKKKNKKKKTDLDQWIMITQWGAAALGALLIISLCIRVFVKHKDSSTATDSDETKVVDKSKTGYSSTASSRKQKEERDAADYVFFVGGSLRINGNNLNLRNASDLPRNDFVISEINLRFNKLISDEGLSHFKKCDSLIACDLDSTPISDQGLENLKNCQKLTILNLNGTSVTDSGLPILKQFSELHELILSNTAISDQGLIQLKECPELAILNLAGSKITDQGILNFKDNDHLKSLNLKSTPITDESIRVLQSCKSLQYLNVQQTKVTFNALGTFHNSLPECKIEHDEGVIQP